MSKVAQWYNGSIELTKINKEVLTRKDGRVFMDFSIGIFDEADNYNQIAMVCQRASSEAYKTMTDEEKKSMPIIGNLKQFPKKETETSPIDDLF